MPPARNTLGKRLAVILCKRTSDGTKAKLSAGDRRTLLVGLPKGRFAGLSHQLLARLGANPQEEDGDRYVLGGITFVLLKASDCAFLLDAGILDASVVPEEWLLEIDLTCDSSRFEVHGRCGWIQASIAWLRPLGLQLTGQHGSLSVVTPFRGIAKSLISSEVSSSASVVHVLGSIEALVSALNVVGLDIVESGASARRYGLSVDVVRTNLDVVLATSAERPMTSELGNLVRLVLSAQEF